MSGTVILIPARFASSRYPGKPLALLRGRSGVGRTLLDRTLDAARAAAAALPGGAAVAVATDDDRIAGHARDLGAAVVMTSPGCRNGTERVAEAVARLGGGFEVVVNLQGDAPLTPAHFVPALVAGLAADPGADMATPVLRCDAGTVANLLADRRAGRVGATTAVFGAGGRALYFSKEVLPFTGGRAEVDGVVPVFHHVGLYAYRPAALAAYAGWPVGPLETLEGLEQLRFLENGRPVACVEVTAPGARFWELNNPSDVPLIERYLAEMGID